MLRSSSLALTMLLLTTTVWGQCIDGCLRCNKIDENSSDCLICDAPGFYVPFGRGLCIKLEVEGCEVPTVDRSMNKCLKCKTGFIFDTVTDSCKEVADKIDNCKDYDLSADCAFCEDGFYLNDAKCVAVPTDNVKQNCSIYNSDATACLACKANFYLNAKSGECEAISKVDNCIGYSQNMCLSCESGYIVDNNYRLSVAIDDTYFQRIVQASVLGSSADTFLYNANIENCRKTTVLNCSQFETFEKCSVCEAGYFLNDEGKKCTLLPQEPIKNCLIYTNATTCATCVNGAYKDGDNCTASTIVENCEDYSQLSDACSMCKYGFYKSGSSCVPRTILEQANQCKTFEVDEDKCAECNPNFVMSTNREKCLSNIPKCSSPSVDSFDNVTCSACEVGYGLSGGLCALRDVDECMSWDGNNATCGECNEGFYVHDGGMKCSENTTSNCNEKSKVANECVECNSNFYLDTSDNNTCKIQTIEDCGEFVSNENRCETCLTGFFKVGTGQSCGRYTLRNCTDPTVDANTCDNCKLGYYPDPSHDDKCAPQDRENCTGYTLNENTCENCNDGFWLATHADGYLYCKLKDKSDCEEYEDTLTNDNCQTCNTGFWLDGGDCTAQSITECQTYNDNVNECSKCNNLFQGTTCTAVSNPGCKTTNGVTGDCTVCEKTHVKNGTTCTQRSTTAPVKAVDQVCDGNTFTADDGTCSECPDNNYRFKVQIFSWKTETVTGIAMANCLEWNTSDNTCLQCKEGFGTNASQDTCSNAAITDDLCIQKLSANVGDPLATNKDCATCKTGYYIAAGTSPTENFCEERTFLSEFCLTGKETETADSCQYCKEGGNFANTSSFAVCLDPPTSPNAKCMALDTEDTSACSACLHGGDSVTTCDADGTVESVKNSLVLDTGNVKVTEFLDGTASFYDNCLGITDPAGFGSALGVNSLGNAVCALCNATDHIMVLGSHDGTTQSWAGHTFIANTPLDTTEVTATTPKYKILPWANLPGSVDCMTKADLDATTHLPQKKVVVTPDTDPLDGTDDTVYGGAAMDYAGSAANIGYAIGVDDYIYTIACKKGFYPQTLSTAGWTPSGATTDVEITAPNTIQERILTQCQAYPGTVPMLKRFEGLGYGSASLIPLPVYIQYDSCIQDTEIFFYVGEIKASFTDLDASKSTLLHVELTNSSYDQHCIPDQTTTGEMHTVVENCQVNLSDDDGVDDMTTTATTFLCVSCKPGFKPTYAGDGIGITACTKIDKCDLTNDATNTWMNMCQTCEPGYSWKLAADALEPELDACAQNQVDHCLVIKDSAPTNCMLCEYGYQPNSDQTECIKLVIEDCDEFAYHNLDHLTATTLTTSADNTVKLTNLAAFLNYFGFNGRAQRAKGCNKCGNSKLPHFTENVAPTSFCISTLNHGTLVPNCEIYKAASGICGKCKDGFIVLDTDGSCVAKNASGVEDACISKADDTASAGTNCTLCVGYRAHDSNSCHMYNNCDMVDETSKKCKRCNAGFKPDSTGYECEATAMDDICEVYEMNGICVKCKAAGTSPTNLKNGDTMMQITCNAHHPLANFDENVYIVDISQSGDDQRVTNQVYLPNGEDGSYSKDVTTNNTLVPQTICINIPEVTNCKTMDENTTQCTACDDGYILDSATNTCIDGTVEYCINYDTTPVCTKCDSDHYLASGSECAIRSHTNCKVFVDDADACLECQPDQWKETLTAPNLRCHEYSIQNCKTFTVDANTCSACDAGVRYLDGGECKLFTKQYCKEYSTSEDKCTDCNEDRWLHSTNSPTFECMLYTVQNCAVYEDELDSCDGCLTGFYANGAQCLAPTAQNCETRNDTTDQCDSCVDGTWMDGTLCVDNTAEKCKTKSKTANECSACLPAHWMDSSESNKCKVHSAKNCSTYTLTADTCDSCTTNFYLTGSNACEDNTSMHCTLRSITENKCVTCDENYYLNEHGQCDEVTNTTCVTIISNTNNCGTCISTRYRDSSSGECLALTMVDNCQTYSETQDLCTTCKNGFYKSTDGLSCLPNPDGIIGCTTYTDLTTCSACRNTHYLMNNDCVELTQTPVDNCAAYSGDGICSACDATFSLDGTACASNVATGCLTWANKDTCATCPANALLNNGACTTTSISGCAVTSGSVGAETCVTCDSDKFLNNNTCTASGTTITNCVLYIADGVCGACSAGNYVSPDGSSCDSMNASIFGKHCSTASTNAAPVCSICGVGYLMDDSGACSVSCSAANCFLCDPDDVTKCNMCNTGYHMTPEMVCEENGRDIGIVRHMTSALLVLAFLVMRFDN